MPAPPAVFARVLVLSLGLALTSGCGQDAPTQVQDLAARMCACADTACGEAVHSDYQSFTESNQSVGLRSEAQDRMVKAMREYQQCRSKALVQPKLKAEIIGGSPAPKPIAPPPDG